MKNKTFVVFILSMIVCLSYLVSGALSSGQFDVQVCGDSIVSGFEECDITDLNSQTCVTRGYASGSLSCTFDCMFNESLCVFAPPSPQPTGGSSIPNTENETSSHYTQCNDDMDNDNDDFCDYNGCTINHTWLAPDYDCTNVLDDSEFNIISYEDVTNKTANQTKINEKESPKPTTNSYLIIFLVVLLLLIIAYASYLIKKNVDKNKIRNIIKLNKINRMNNIRFLHENKK